MKLVGKLLKWLGFGAYAVCAVAVVIFLMPVGGWKALNVLTGSMKPAINPGDLVIIHKVHLRDIKRGDVVTYQRNSTQTVTHRVISTYKGMFKVKGDANEAMDAPFPASQVVGKLAFTVPGGGKFINLLREPIGLAGLVIIPGSLVVWAESQSLARALAMPKGGEAKLPVTELENANESELIPRRRRRSLDSMSRINVLALILFIVGIGSTYSLPQTNVAKLIGNKFSVRAISADQCKNGGWKTFKNPDGSPMFNNQGQCVAFVNSAKPGKHTTNSTTTVTITNTNNQSATSGSVSGGGTSGGGGNSNTTSSTVNVTN